MTATAEPPAVTSETPRPSLARAEGVELLGDVHGSGYKEGAALVRRADGQMVQLGPLMYALLEELDGERDVAELSSVLCHRLGRPCDEDAVVALARKLAEQGLLAGSEHNAPPRRNPLLALRWKVLVTNPHVTGAITAPLAFLFRPFILWPVVVCAATAFWFVLVDKGVASGAAEAFHKPELLLLVFALAVVSAAFHELGHAAACRYGGATPGGMGAGIYLVWPAFYTDVTDSYRLPRRDRLRVDLGGIYFNALVAAATAGAWLVWHVDALLLLVALQALMIVKNLSPVIRSDGYHILADGTGIPDLYAHIGPTMRRLVPWKPHERSALTGRARLFVTLWVLIVVPVLLGMMLAAVVLLPRMLTSSWDSGRTIGAALPHELGRGHMLAGLASILRLVALTLPLLGSILVTQRLLRGTLAKAHGWSDGRPRRQMVLAAATALAMTGAAWAWWPAGQYQAIGAHDRGTLVSFSHALVRPAAVVHPVSAAAPRLSGGTHLAVAMIPVGGATKAHPALFVVPGAHGSPAVAIVSTAGPDPSDASGATTAAPTTTEPSTTTQPTTTPVAQPTQAPVAATAFPFTLPAAPRPGDSQAVAVNTKDGGVTYDVAYSLVTVSNGANVTNTNSAFAFASCKACTTVAVSFQVVLIVGESKNIAPINAAGALNVNCPACLTTALADQIVVTLRSQPTAELVQKIRAALAQLNAVSTLGANASADAIAAQVGAVQKQIDDALAQSGQLANTPATTTAATTTSAAVTTPTATTSTSATTTTAATSTTPAATTTSPTPAPAPTTTTTTTTSTTTTVATTTAPTTTAAPPATTTTGNGG